jgi:dihydroneopterin aldolase
MIDWTLADALGIATAPVRGDVLSYRIVVRDLVLPFSIGIHEHEKQRHQRVRINVELTVAPKSFHHHDIDDVLNYEFVVAGIRKFADAGHIDLIETLADGIAALCLADGRVESTRVSVEKLDVYPEAASVGVVVEHRRPPRR